MRDKIDALISKEVKGRDEFKAAVILVNILCGEAIGLFGAFTEFLNYKRKGILMGFVWWMRVLLRVVLVVVVCGASPRPISTGRLGIAAVHLRPINPMVCGGPYHIKCGKPHLEMCFPLRCIQRLSRPNVANQQCPGRDNWHTRGSSIPVLSY